MIDDGIGPNWQAALLPDNRSLRTLSDDALHSPFIVDHIAKWLGCTLAEARDAKGAELLRRTQTTERPG